MRNIHQTCSMILHFAMKCCSQSSIQLKTLQGLDSGFKNAVAQECRNLCHQRPQLLQQHPAKRALVQSKSPCFTCLAAGGENPNHDYKQALSPPLHLPLSLYMDIYIYIYIYAVKLKSGPRFGGFKVKKWSKFKVKKWSKFFFTVFPPFL